jgi:RimJ/RimL family protein N-acetyltransferase
MTAAYPGPAYRIVTPRLVIRCYDPADAPLLKASVDDNIDHLIPWLPWAALEPQELQEKVNLLRRFRGAFDLGQDFIYGIFNRDETRLLGGTGLHTRLGSDVREIGYWIHKDYTGQGLATESSAALTKVAFEIDCVTRVEIHCDPLNTASSAVAQKLGYAHEATLPRRIPMADGSLRASMIWTLHSEEYPDSPSAQAPVEAYDAARRRIL